MSGVQVLLSTPKVPRTETRVIAISTYLRFASVGRAVDAAPAPAAVGGPVLAGLRIRGSSFGHRR